MSDQDRRRLTDETHSIWDQNASFWDNYMGEGNDFHRPLSVLLKPCFRSGFVLDGLREPVFDPQVQNGRSFSWGNFTEIPPVLTVRLRLMD